MRRNIFFIVCIFLLLPASNLSAEPVIQAEIDKLKLTTDETLTYKLSITSEVKNIPEPELPNFEGFLVLSNMQTSSISFQKDKTEIKIVYAITLLPNKTGELKIAPSRIKIDDQFYSTQEFGIEVIQGKAPPSEKNPLNSGQENDESKITL